MYMAEQFEGQIVVMQVLGVRISIISSDFAHWYRQFVAMMRDRPDLFRSYANEEGSWVFEDACMMFGERSASDCANDGAGAFIYMLDSTVRLLPWAGKMASVKQVLRATAKLLK